MSNLITTIIDQNGNIILEDRTPAYGPGTYIMINGIDYKIDRVSIHYEYGQQEIECHEISKA